MSWSLERIPKLSEPSCIALQASSPRTVLGGQSTPPTGTFLKQKASQGVCIELRYVARVSLCMWAGQLKVGVGREMSVPGPGMGVRRWLSWLFLLLVQNSQGYKNGRAFEGVFVKEEGHIHFI